MATPDFLLITLTGLLSVAYADTSVLYQTLHSTCKAISAFYYTPITTATATDPALSAPQQKTAPFTAIQVAMIPKRCKICSARKLHSHK